MSDIRDNLVSENRRRLHSLARRLLAPRWEADNELSLTATERRELDGIYRTLRRIDAGRYGRCAGCGGRIANRRLRRDPCTGHCARCARDRPAAAVQSTTTISSVSTL